MHKYQAKGAVYPAQTKVSVVKYSMIVHTRGTSISLVTVVKNNEIDILAECPEPWDQFDLMALCESAVQDMLNGMAFVLLRPTEAYVYATRDQTGKETLHPGKHTSADVSEVIEGRLHEHVSAIVRLLGNPNGHSISMALDDFRLALRRSRDTAFHCYRAIECLRNYCAARYAIPDANRGAQWAKLRAIAAIDKAEIDPITKAAEAIRHGDFEGISASERSDLIERTRTILDRFLRNEFAPPQSSVSA